VTTPVNQNGFASPPAPRASGSVIALGVFSIVYSLLFRFCCGFISLVSALFAAGFLAALHDIPQVQGVEMPPLEAMLTGPMQGYAMIKGFVLLTFGILLLIGGIGTLSLKSWGRNLLLGVATAEIVWVLVDFAINVFFIYPWMMEKMGEEFSRTPQMIGNIVFGIIFALVKLAYPVVLLVCLNLQSVKRQFEPAVERPQWQT